LLYQTYLEIINTIPVAQGAIIIQMKNSRIKTSLIILFVIALVVVLLDFLSHNQPHQLNESQSQTVLEYADPLADRLLQGINSGDFHLFNADFSDQLNKDFTEQDFIKLKQQFASYGSYQSRRIREIQFENGNMILFYQLVFEHATPDMRLIVEPDRNHQVRGLAFKTASTPTPAP
jgi:hypothetical protein